MHTSSKTENDTLVWRTCAVLSYRREKKPCVKSPLPFDFRKGTSKPKGSFSFLPVTQKVTKWTSSGWRSNAPAGTRTAKMCEWWQGSAVWGQGNTPKPLPQVGQHSKQGSAHLLQTNKSLQRGAICNCKNLLKSALPLTPSIDTGLALASHQLCFSLLYI